MVENRRKSPPILEGFTEEEKNELIGNAIDSWLDKKWAKFGKWTARGVGAAAFSYLVYFLATHGGLNK